MSARSKQEESISEVMVDISNEDEEFDLAGQSTFLCKMFERTFQDSPRQRGLL